MLASLAQASARHDNESQSVKGKWGSGVFSRRGQQAEKLRLLQRPMIPGGGSRVEGQALQSHIDRVAGRGRKGVQFADKRAPHPRA